MQNSGKSGLLPVYLFISDSVMSSSGGPVLLRGTIAEKLRCQRQANLPPNSAPRHISGMHRPPIKPKDSPPPLLRISSPRPNVAAPSLTYGTPPKLSSPFPPSLLRRRDEPVLHRLPVDDVPDGVDVLGPHVPVVDVVGVLPDVDPEEGHEAGGRLEGVLVGAGGRLDPPFRVEVCEVVSS